MLKKDPESILKALGTFIVVCVVTNCLRDQLRKRDLRLRRTHELFDELFLARGHDNKISALEAIVTECKPRTLVKVAFQQHVERGNDDRICLLLQALHHMGPRGERCLNKTFKLLRSKGYNV